MYYSTYANRTLARFPALDSIETTKLVHEKDGSEMETPKGSAFKGIISGLILCIPFWGLIAYIAIWLV
jgi:hypothetical protein